MSTTLLLPSDKTDVRAMLLSWLSCRKLLCSFWQTWAVNYINATDTTPRDDWRAISPQLLRACEEALVYLQPLAFCYVLPAYLRQFIQRPDFMCTDSIFSCMSHTTWDRREKLAPLTPAQCSVVEDVMNEYRLREQKNRGDYQEDLLPWEYDLYLRQGNGASTWTFAGNLALNYAAPYGN